MRQFRILAKILGFALLLLGIYWIPADLRDWREAVEPWKRMLSMVDQNIALWVTIFFAFSYIVWMDIWPFVSAKLDRNKLPFSLLKDGKTRVIGTEDVDCNSATFYRYQFLIGAKNRRRHRLSGVRLNISSPEFGDIALEPLSSTSGDVAPGEELFFPFCELCTKSPISQFMLQLAQLRPFEHAEKVPPTNEDSILWLLPYSERPVAVLLDKSDSWDFGSVFEATILCNECDPQKFFINYESDANTLVKVSTSMSPMPKKQDKTHRDARDMKRIEDSLKEHEAEPEGDLDKPDASINRPTREISKATRKASTPASGDN